VWTAAADIEVVFRDKAGIVRYSMASYGLDDAFPDSLQPVLPRINEWASTEWHH
jgi:hypothetical protein